MPPALAAASAAPPNVPELTLHVQKKPRSAGPFRCAREDSNLHGELSPQGPQPCASTNSATGAEGASIARWGRQLAACGSGMSTCGHLAGAGPFASTCIRPRGALQCEHVFVPGQNPPDRGVL